MKKKNRHEIPDREKEEAADKWMKFMLSHKTEKNENKATTTTTELAKNSSHGNGIRWHFPCTNYIFSIILIHLDISAFRHDRFIFQV